MKVVVKEPTIKVKEAEDYRKGKAVDFSNEGIQCSIKASKEVMIGKTAMGEGFGNDRRYGYEGRCRRNGKGNKNEMTYQTKVYQNDWDRPILTF